MMELLEAKLSVVVGHQSGLLHHQETVQSVAHVYELAYVGRGLLMDVLSDRIYNQTLFNNSQEMRTTSTMMGSPGKKCGGFVRTVLDRMVTDPRSWLELIS